MHNDRLAQRRNHLWWSFDSVKKAANFTHTGKAKTGTKWIRGAISTWEKHIASISLPKDTIKRSKHGWGVNKDITLDDDDSRVLDRAAVTTTGLLALMVRWLSCANGCDVLVLM